MNNNMYVYKNVVFFLGIHDYYRVQRMTKWSHFFIKPTNTSRYEKRSTVYINNDAF